MQQSRSKRRPYLVLIGFCLIAALPVISAGIVNRSAQINLNRPLDTQVQKYAPVGSSTSKAIAFMESNGFACSVIKDPKEPFVKCVRLERKWYAIYATGYEVIFDGRDLIESIHCSEYSID